MKKLIMFLLLISAPTFGQSITITPSGGVQPIKGAVVTITANYTALATDNLILCNNGSTNITITLPAPASTNIGTKYIIKIKISTVSGTVTISSTNVQAWSANTFSSSATLSGTAAVYESDGTNWHLIEKY